MSPQQAVEFLKAIRVSNINPKGNGWIVGSCPLARWRHKHAFDKNPSFGMSAKTGESSGYNCFACGTGSAEELLHQLEMYVPQEEWHLWNFKAAHLILQQEEIEVVPLPEYGEFGQQGQIFEEWPAYWLDSFKPVSMFPEAMQYLASRNVGQETIEKHNLRYDTNRAMIVCPYWTVFGRFAGARGRSIVPGTEGIEKHYDYRFQGSNNSKLVWYNERCLNLDGAVVVVEGQFDVWRTQQAWEKTVGNLTALPTADKVKKLADSPLVVVIPDNDETGSNSCDAYHSLFKQMGIPHTFAKLAESVKDPDECHPKYLHKIISEAIADGGW